MTAGNSGRVDMSHQSPPLNQYAVAFVDCVSRKEFGRMGGKEIGSDGLRFAVGLGLGA